MMRFHAPLCSALNDKISFIKNKLVFNMTYETEPLKKLEINSFKNFQCLSGGKNL